MLVVYALFETTRLYYHFFLQVTIRVLDTNDNSPVFQSALYVFNILENVTQTSTVGTVLAEDRDQGV